MLDLPGLPCGGGLWGSLQLIAERIGLELRYDRGICAIEDDLDRDGHATEPKGPAQVTMVQAAGAKRVPRSTLDSSRLP